MGTRGRESAADLQIVKPTSLDIAERPAPPSDLTTEQAVEWNAIVSRLPADWFPRETWAMLAQYCRHVVSAGRISQMIREIECGPATSDRPNVSGEDNGEGFSLKDYDNLLKMQEREGRAMSSLATRMRITQQSTFDKERKKGKSGMVKKPWE